MIRALILQMYFPSFTSLLAESAAESLLEEFEGYVTARLNIKAGDFDAKAVKKAFSQYGIAMPADPSPAEYLSALDQEVPEDFPRLAANEAFVRFVNAIRQDESSGEAFRIVREKEEDEKKYARQAQVAGGPESGAWAGRVLWIDDHPENNQVIAGQLRNEGFDIIEARSLEEARPHVEKGVDAIISDIRRDDGSSDGFRDLRALRDGGFSGPALFYTTRVTASDRRKAEKLNARISTSAAEVRNWILQTLRGDIEGSAAAGDSFLKS